MTSHSSATTRETPHAMRKSRTNTIDDAVKQRAQAVLNDSAALFVLMEALQTSSEPTALAHVVKHFAFTRCGELNVFGMVDSQAAVLERELFA